MTDNILNPCPFCGAEAELHHLKILERWSVFCSGEDGYCTVKPELESYYDTRDAAIAAWNTRAPDSTVTAKLEELQARIKELEGKK